MTIDERLEALTHSVELLAAMQLDHERQAAEWQRQAAEWQRQAAERNVRLDRRLAEIMESINTLGRIAGLHQDRLDDHEERLDDLEKQ
jgi:hypothetical protein